MIIFMIILITGIAIVITVKVKEVYGEVGVKILFALIVAIGIICRLLMRIF